MKRTQAQSLTREKALIPSGLAILTATVVTGLATYWASGFMAWIQWNYLAHTLTGAVLAVLMIPYVLHHAYRTLGVRRITVLVTGLFTALVMALLAVTGLFFAFHGQTETTRWVYELHVMNAFLFLGLLVLHLVLHLARHNKQNRQAPGTRFLSLERTAVLRGLGSALLLLLCIGLLTVLYKLRESPYSDQARVATYDYSYGAHPFRPSQTETASGKFIDRKQIANSISCSSCHAQIFREWRSSIHSQAASDRAYITNVTLLAEKKGITATRYCEGCHAPAALLTGELSPGGEHGGIANTLANREGVSCMGCHGITEAIHLKGVASYRFTPAQDYLFGGSENSLARLINNFLIRTHPEEHRNNMAPAILTSPTLCATCHAQFMNKDMNNWGWVKMQDEYSAWLNSHYSGSTNQTFANEQVSRCQDCHMPKTPGADPSADHNGMIASHRTLGANTAIPHFTTDLEQLQLVTKFLQSDKMRISIEKPWRTDATRSDLHLPEHLRSRDETPHYLYLGETALLRISVTNQGVGHDFPGGTIDINEAWVDFMVTDAGGNTVYHSGSIDAEQNVDNEAVFYRALAVDRHGNHVWKHDLFNMIGDSYRKVIKPGESDIVEYQFTVPAWAKGPLTATALLRYRKFNARYARWALKDEDVELPVTDVARHSITIPVIEKPGAHDKLHSSSTPSLL